MGTTPINVEVDDSEVGRFFKLLRRTPGVIKFDVDLEAHAPPPQLRRTEERHGEGRRPKPRELVMAILARRDGLTSGIDIQRETRLNKNQVFAALAKLRAEGFAQKKGRGMYQLTLKAKRGMGMNGDAVFTEMAPDMQALPAPTITKTKSGRLAKGTGWAALRSALATPAKRAVINHFLADKGVPSSSVNGVIERAKRDKLIQRDPEGVYHLTQKGQEQPNVSAGA